LIKVPAFISSLQWTWPMSTQFIRGWFWP